MEKQDLQLTDDTLTGLRFLLLSRPDTPQFLRESVGNKSVSLIYGDIDNLKGFQDYHGLPLGDALLRVVADVIRSLLPESANAYRAGGDEFLVVLPSHSLEQAIEVAEAIRGAVANIKLDAYGKGTAQSPGITLGIAASSETDWDATRLIQQANEANIKGKNDGKNRVSY